MVETTSEVKYGHILDTHDLSNPHCAKDAYDTALRYNPNNQDAKQDRTLPHWQRARRYNKGASGSAAKYVNKGSLCRVIITENENSP